MLPLPCYLLHYANIPPNYSYSLALTRPAHLMHMHIDPAEAAPWVHEHMRSNPYHPLTYLSSTKPQLQTLVYPAQLTSCTCT